MRFSHEYRILVCLLVLLDILAGKPAQAEEMLDYIIGFYHDQCGEIYASTHDNGDNIEESIDDGLIIFDDSIYEIQLTPQGVMGTVVYADFLCGKFGSGWCGIGGCGFHIIVDDVAYFRMSGYKPTSVTIGNDTLVVIPIDGPACDGSDGVRARNYDRCHVVATWNDSLNTFLSIDQKLRLSPIMP